MTVQYFLLSTVRIGVVDSVAVGGDIFLKNQLFVVNAYLHDYAVFPPLYCTDRCRGLYTSGWRYISEESSVCCKCLLA
jgi:hypothetical protein